MNKTILLTGGAGYIGSHTAVELAAAGYDPILLDNFANSEPSVIKRIETIVGRPVTFYEGDACDRELLLRIFDEQGVQAVIHFAAHKAVGESVAKPLAYYQNNLQSTLALLDSMRERNVKGLIFSSSATVYGHPSDLPLKEDSRVGVGITNPYGWTKFFNEQIIHDVAAADSTVRFVSLRYFNPIGAHESGLLGENPKDIPNNLMPYIARVASGTLAELSIYGDDYETPDGSGVRDYIHVVDLAKGHVAALRYAGEGMSVPYEVFNLGTGRGVSVFELFHAFERVCGRTLPSKVVGRRPGDVAECYADPSKAQQVLGWRAEKSVEQSCQDTWHWQQNVQKGL